MIANDSEAGAAVEAVASEPKRKTAKRPKLAKKQQRANEASPKRKGERGDKKAAVIELMMRAKGATLAEIMKATGWQAHTVRGFVSILGTKVGQKIESSKRADGERTYKIK